MTPGEAKSIAITMLETKIADLEQRNHDLVVYNNELLMRARKCEEEKREFDALKVKRI